MSTARTCASVLAAILAAACLALPAQAQPRSPVHYPYRADQPPGTIGLSQLQRGGAEAVRGYFQPVELYCPDGARVTLEVEGHFADAQSSRVRAGMLIGPVYRAKVTDIPDHPGEEVYPTVEVINRLFPPPGHEARFPIPIHITQEELELALEGNLVTRVVYLEHPDGALPLRERPTFQRYYEVHPRQDPLQVADEQGRPMAILRMGSRIPDALGQMGMNYGSPPLIQYELPEDLPVEAAPDALPPEGEAATTTAAWDGGGLPARADGRSQRDVQQSSAIAPAEHSILLPRGRPSHESPAARRPANMYRMPGFARELFQPRLPQ